MQASSANTSPLRLNSPQHGAAHDFVGIVLVHYKAWPHTVACLDALHQLHGMSHCHVFVIDNASQDGSEAAFATWWHQAQVEWPGPPVQWLAQPDNLGFGAGCNVGIQAASEAGATYIWLLNNDAQPDPMALAGLLAEVRRTGGLVGSVLRYPDGRYQQVGSRISLWTGRIRGLPEQALYHGMPIPYLCGGSVLAPTAVLKQLQGFDPNYFLYFEDADLTQRARQAGLPVTLALDSVVFHVEGGTTGKTSDLTRYYFQRNRLRFSWQYAKGLQKVTLLLYTLVRLARAWLKQGKTRPNLDITAILDFFNNDLRFFADADAAPKSPGFGRR